MRSLDCFVAEPVIGPATSGRTRWLLAMTKPLFPRLEIFRPRCRVARLRWTGDAGLAAVRTQRAEFGAGAQGRSKFGGRAESMTKPAPSRRSASAPRARQRLRPITVAAQSGGASRVATMTVARAAILLECVRRQRVGD